jgi:N-acetyltransferase
MELNFADEYILENDRVMLRPLALSDKEFLQDYAVNEPDIWQFNAHGANGLANLDRYVSNAIAQRDAEKEYSFIVFDKSTQHYVGSTRFYSIFPLLKTIEIGYTWYGKKHQGSGINKNCKYLLLQFAFEHLAMERVAFAANAKNERSINAMKSIGCTVEGILRNSNIGANGERIDVIRLSILKDEWYSHVKANLMKTI